MEKAYKIPSSDGIHMLHCVSWNPVEPSKAVIVLVHGMMEHIGRYAEFASYLCGRGYAVYGYDQLGHGRTARNTAELGFFAEKHGEQIVIKDIHRVVSAVKKRHPKRDVILFGYSMGSFFCRKFYTVYGAEVDGLILCGTGSTPVPVLAAGYLLSKAICLVKGKKYRSSLLHSLVFSSNNRAIPNPETERDWLTKDKEKLAENMEDPFCNFRFTARAYQDFFYIMYNLSRKQGYRKMPTDKPVLLISGGLDPVGHQGEDVAALYDTYRELGMNRVSLILCEEDRHEILNETDRRAVYQQIGKWLEERNQDK